jgi:acyl-coenzyme A synthetase/AMP-(fatty) acid ligase
MEKQLAVLRRGAHLAHVADHAAARTPLVPIRLDRPLDLYPAAGTHLDYATLAELTRRCADSLASLGVGRGDRVAVVKRNHLDIFVLACAASRLGAVPALISNVVPPEAARALLEELRPAALITDEETLEEGALRGDAASGLADRTYLAGDERIWSAGSSETQREPHVPSGLDEMELITHTSGTTGTPKLVVQTVETIDATVGLSVSIPRLLRIDETVGACLSFCHIRTNTGLIGLLLTGLPLVVATDPDPASVADLFARTRPGIVESYPNVYITWERLADHPKRPFANVRWFLSTFDAAHPRTIRRLLDASDRRFALYLQMYGQTETGPVTMRPYTRRTADRADGRCVGYPAPGFSKVRVRAGRDGPGRIVARTKGRTPGYLRDGKVVPANVVDGWWEMTDVGERGRWGCLHVLDREVDRTDGVESLLRAEDLLLERLDQATEVVLIPRPGAIPLAVVCTHGNEPLAAGAWEEATRDLPAFDGPVHMPWDEVPHTQTWKVRRSALRELLAARVTPSVSEAA